MDTVSFKLDAFEGPLDLLLHLIDKNEINIYDIPISEITNQYFKYIDTYDKRNMDNISEFIVMAASLLEMKSKMLLPNEKSDDEDIDIDPREELIRRLIEYKRFKEITEIFKETEVFVDKVAFKDQETELIEDLIGEKLLKIEDALDGVTLEKLNNIFLDVMRRKEFKVDKVRASFGKIERDEYTIDIQIDLIINLLETEKKLLFSKIFESSSTKTEVVVTFLALLEMIKKKIIKIMQEDVCSEIYIYKNY